jgi:hypothetical protein
MLFSLASVGYGQSYRGKINYIIFILYQKHERTVGMLVRLDEMSFRCERMNETYYRLLVLLYTVNCIIAAIALSRGGRVPTVIMSHSLRK